MALPPLLARSLSLYTARPATIHDRVRVAQRSRAMSNITGLVNELLHQHDPKLICGGGYSLQSINEFLKQAYQINSRIGELIGYLRSIRQPYLSTAPPPRRKQPGSAQVYFTNAQRDTIDAEAKSTLRDLHAAVSALSEAEKSRHQLEEEVLHRRRQRKGLGALGKWAAGGAALDESPEEAAERAKAATAKAHHEGVVWFLQSRLAECSRVQSSMMEIRITREVERGKSVLHQASSGATVPVGHIWDDAYEPSQTTRARGGAANDATTLSAEQVQLFEQENQAMLKQYQDRLDQVRTAEKSLVEISELQSTLATNLSLQQAHIDQLTQDSFFATENVAGGNRQLKKASERRNLAQLIFFGSCGLCGFLVLWDLVF